VNLLADNSDKGVPPVKESIGALIHAQHDALESATFVGMSEQQAAEYDDRARRIKRLQDALDSKPPHTPW
jgi:hypothetical protein